MSDQDDDDDSLPGKDDNQTISFEELERHIATQFTPEELAELEKSAAEFEALGKGLVLDRWDALAPAALLFRERAMLAAGAKRARGQPYNSIWRGFVARFFPSLTTPQNMKQLTSLLWIHATPERRELYAEWRSKLPASELLNITSPKTVENRLRKIIAEREREAAGEPARERVVPNWVKQETKKREATLDFVLEASPDEITTMLRKAGAETASQAAVQTIYSIVETTPEKLDYASSTQLVAATTELLLRKAKTADASTAAKTAQAIAQIWELFRELFPEPEPNPFMDPDPRVRDPMVGEESDAG
jgi:hypothetical protein